MPSPGKVPSLSSENRSGLLYALAGFAVLSMGDGVIKSMAGEWSPVAISALRFTLAAVALGLMAFYLEGAKVLREMWRWPQAGRGLALAISSTIFFTSLFLLPLATATAINFTSPMFTGLFAAVWRAPSAGVCRVPDCCLRSCGWCRGRRGGIWQAPVHGAVC